MKATMHNLAWSLALLLAASAPAAAMTLRDGAAPSPQDKPATRDRNAAGARQARATLDLVEGRLSAVDAAQRTVTIGGKVIATHPTRLRVFVAGGGSAGFEALQAGARVRFALEPGAADPRPIVLIYVERAQ
jgi:hypothetical protein